MGNHRAERRAPRADTSASQQSGGKRKAVKHVAARAPLFAKLPSTPILLGVAALAVSAGGAVTASQTGADLASSGDFHFSSQVSALNGASDVSAISSRDDEVSRDSSRDGQSGDSSQSEVEQQAAERNAALSQLAQAAQKQAKKIEANYWVLPVSGYHITNTFGTAASYYSSGYHTGLDFACPSGTPIHAIADGTITEKTWDNSYGWLTVMTLEDGTEIYYGHQLAYAEGLDVGDQIDQGDVIGLVGETGNAFGAHLHIEVRPGGGDPVDPYPAFVVHGVTP
ncbi:MAG TPA: M23 family metallopeptidase [Nocardioides sp.]|jgi:murein DD-endopeptidase MepM/ murein hydrolase activator NlpD